MPKKARELTALEVRRLSHPNPKTGQKHRYPVGGVNGLYLVCAPNGPRSWLWRYSIRGRRKSLGLGPYPDVPLATARDRAREMADLVWRGTDPKDDRSNQVMSFSGAMEALLKIKLQEFDNEKHRKQWRATLDTYAVPFIGDLSVAEITVADVLRVLNPIWQSKTETASRLRGRMEMVLAWATVNGHREGDNPARWRGNLDATLPKPSRVTKTANHPALSLADAPNWFADVQSRDGTATRALEFLAMTAARSGEVRGATWTEIDLEADLWIIPAERMKARKEHRVPLTVECKELLQKLPRLLNSPYVFPAARGGMLSDAALSVAMKRINASNPDSYLDRVSARAAVPHGLRSTFRDWAAERGYPRDMAEIALAHSVGSEVERAYRRSDLLARRRAMMTSWGAFLRGEEGAAVIKLDGRA